MFLKNYYTEFMVLQVMVCVTYYIYISHSYLNEINKNYKSKLTRFHHIIKIIPLL